MLSSVDREKVRIILALHETCVVSMADGYARVSGKPTPAQKRLSC
ncbi:MAG: thiamine pyrophosphate-binding protein [Candidatus Binatia bacterium]